jgi:lipopolysaccharide biosynthesis protein
MIKKTEIEKITSLFDPVWYLQNYPDVSASGLDPFEHFLKIGNLLGRPACQGEFIKKEYQFNIKQPKENCKNSNNVFLEYARNDKINSIIKPVAFYLPQFHPFPENDKWWGKGFTEWTNVTKARPNFSGHYQPHLPIHLGYYDLRVPEIMEEQAALAKNYGIYGFNFYFYWFNGKTLMEKPLIEMRSNTKVDINYCLTWANENWTRRWDGQENDILIAQNYSIEDAKKFINHIIPYFKDERYIKIDDKPLLCIYRPKLIPDLKSILNIFRDSAIKAGFSDLYLVCIRSFDNDDPRVSGFDAAAQFPPLYIPAKNITSSYEFINKSYQGSLYDYDDIASNGYKEAEPDYKLFRSVMMGWDNTARRQNNSHAFPNYSLDTFSKWQSAIYNNLFYNDKYSNDEKIVFVNAWNEWAEGTHLEPDVKYGYAQLNSVYSNVKNYPFELECILKKQPIKKSNYAIALHLFYTDLWEEIAIILKNLLPLEFDVFITVVDGSFTKQILKDFPDANVRVVDNRGRDILPFIKLLPELYDMKYQAVCKIHSKKSLHRQDGSVWRKALFDDLLGNYTHVSNIVTRFTENKNLGILIPKNNYATQNYENMASNLHVYNELKVLLDLNDSEHKAFPAGSMFWFRPEAMLPLRALSPRIFDYEMNMIDGTLPHAVERIFSLVSIRAGYTCEVT